MDEREQGTALDVGDLRKRAAMVRGRGMWDEMVRGIREL
jgi:hypothetical protein